MLKKSILLLGMVILSLNSFSQNVTDIDTTKIVLTIEVARQVAIDLIEGDQAKVEVVELRGILGNTGELLSTQDSLLSIKDQNLKKVSQQNVFQELQIRGLESEKRSISSQLKNWKICAGAGWGATVLVATLFILCL